MECVTNKIGGSLLCYENDLLLYKILNFFSLYYVQIVIKFLMWTVIIQTTKLCSY